MLMVLKEVTHAIQATRRVPYPSIRSSPHFRPAFSFLFYLECALFFPLLFITFSLSNVVVPEESRSTQYQSPGPKKFLGICVPFRQVSICTSACFDLFLIYFGRKFRIIYACFQLWSSKSDDYERDICWINKSVTIYEQVAIIVSLFNFFFVFSGARSRQCDVVSILSAKKTAADLLSSRSLWSALFEIKKKLKNKHCMRRVFHVW